MAAHLESREVWLLRGEALTRSMAGEYVMACRQPSISSTSRRCCGAGHFLALRVISGYAGVASGERNSSGSNSSPQYQCVLAGKNLLSGVKMEKCEKPREYFEIVAKRKYGNRNRPMSDSVCAATLNVSFIHIAHIGVEK